MTEHKCPECESLITTLHRRNYPMVTPERGRYVTKTYLCEMCSCEFTREGEVVELDRKQTLSSGNYQGYHKTF